MPRGASPKREREYEHLKERFEDEGRYPGREAEVASRIVNKQRRQYGETRVAKQEERSGRSPDRDLPIPNYRHLTIPQVVAKLRTLSAPDRRKIERYERAHKNRKTLLAKLSAKRAA